MLYSMTGFGRSFLEDANWTQTWEVRSVNGRHLDIRWRLPHLARPLEPALEKTVKQVATRGRLEISLYLQAHSQNGQAAAFNAPQAEAIITALSQFAAARGDTFTPDYNRFLTFSSLWEDTAQDTNEELTKSLTKGLTLALNDWNNSRKQEALSIKEDITTRIANMEQWLAVIAERAPHIKTERFAVVQERVNEVLEKFGKELEEGRFLQEITMLADKMDVSEELTRLAAHFSRLHELMALGKDAGRKLDFTLQECFREITTCGNKIQDLQVSHLIVDLKNELEKCREQVQNVE